MILHRPASARGRIAAEGLDSRHAFSSGAYYDPAWMGFGCLRVANEVRLAPGASLPAHRYANMDVLSYVLEGELLHRDSAGEECRTGAGALQWLGAGHGVQRSAHNASGQAPLHFFQFWIQPDRLNARPAVAVAAPQPGEGEGDFALLASRDGQDGGLPVRQDLRLHRLRLAPGGRARRSLDPARSYWLQLLDGAVEAAGRPLAAGDALAWSAEGGELDLSAAPAAPAHLLLFDLPPLR